MRVADILAHKIQYFLNKNTYQQLVLCGGVFANQTIRTYLSKTLDIENISIPSLPLCTDNAAMIGLAAEMYLRHPKLHSLSFSCFPQLGLRYPGL